MAEELKKGLEEEASFKASELERLVMTFCKQTRLKYNRLTEEKTVACPNRAQARAGEKPDQSGKQEAVTGWTGLLRLK